MKLTEWQTRLIRMYCGDDTEAVIEWLEDKVMYFLDHEGNLIGPDTAEYPTGSEKYAGITHYLFRPQAGQLIQAMSLCGHRVHVVPGTGKVNCHECEEAHAGRN